jgi:hypothetical protein
MDRQSCEAVGKRMTEKLGGSYECTPYRSPSDVQSCHRLMLERGFPPPWSVEETEPCFIVRDADGHALKPASLASRQPTSIKAIQSYLSRKSAAK